MKEYLDREYYKWQSGDRKKNLILFAKYLGVEYGALSAWMNGTRKPRRDNVAKLSERLGLEVYDIAGLARPSDLVDLPRPDPIKRRVTTILDSLNDDGKQKLANYAEKLFRQNQRAMGKSDAGAEAKAASVR